MKFSDMAEALERGKKVRNKKWADKGVYIHLKDGSLLWGSGTTCYLDNKCVTDDWELFDDKVEVGTLKEGDLFECGECTYRLLPAYMLQYTAGRNIASGYQPIVNHNTGRLDYISSNGKVKKVNG